MKKFTVEFEDVVKYRFTVSAEDEREAKAIVARMENYERYEVDRNEHSETKIVKVEV